MQKKWDSDVSQLPGKRGLMQKGNWDSEQQGERNCVGFVKESDADMLVIGAHGHTALKDFIYGGNSECGKARIKDPGIGG